jgi:spermidine dehydrogenase
LGFLPQKKQDPQADRALGMDAEIARADFLDGRPQIANPAGNAAAKLAQADWDGYGGEGDYAKSNGNTYSVMTAGHGIRDSLYAGGLKDAHVTGETFDCVVVGGGISGLAAAHLYSEKTNRSKRCLVLEDHAIFGGEARRNEFVVDGQRLIANQGSAMFFPPLPLSLTQKFYESIGFDGKPFEYQRWGGGKPELKLTNLPYMWGGPNSGMFFGARFGHPEGHWLMDPWGKNLAGAPFSEDVKRQLLKSRKGNPSFVTPRADGDAVARALDKMSFEDHLMQRDGLTREFIRAYMPNAADGAGASADEISAYANYAPEVLFPWNNAAGEQIFPGGNTGIARFIVKAMIPEALPGPTTLSGICSETVDFSKLDREGQPVRIRLGATVADVRHEGDGVRVSYAVQGRLFTVHARSVVMAGGWTTWRSVSDLPEDYRLAYQQFHRMPCIVMNVALRNWRFLAKMGITECQWFEGLSNSFAVRRMATFGGVPPTISPDDPTVVRIKISFTEPGVPLAQQATRGRMRLLSTSYSEYERMIREQFTLMFARAGFDARRDIAGVILNRWGHAYLCAQPGFFFGTEGKIAPREIIRRAPFGKIAFANSDLSGIMDHRASIAEADRAVGQLLA